MDYESFITTKRFMPLCDFMKDAWREMVGKCIVLPNGIYSYISLVKSEWSVVFAMVLQAKLCNKYSRTFEKLMRNRLIQGSYRYGKLNDEEKKKLKYDRLERMKFEVEEFKKDGNKERLVDIANMAMLEFEETDHPNAHFEAVGYSKRVGTKTG